MRRAAIALVLVIAALAAGCGEDEQPEGTERFSVRGQDAALIRPAGSVSKVVLYTHGSGETAGTVFGNLDAAGLLRPLLDAGYAVATTTARGNNWGNPESLRDYVALAGNLRERGLDELYMVSLSMGGMTGLPLLDDLKPKAWAGIYVACDLDAMVNLDQFTGDIRAAYGLDGDDPITSVTRARSPVEIRPQQGLPMQFWASPDDTLVEKTRNTDVCARRARAAGAQVTVTTASGEHVDPSHFDAAALLHLFTRAD